MSETKAYPKTRVWPTAAVLLVLMATPLAAMDCPEPQRTLQRLTPTLARAVNPNPDEMDITLPMPCGARLVLRHVCVAAQGFFGDLRFDLGCSDCGREGLGFMEGRRKASISGPFTIEDLPEQWQLGLYKAARDGDGTCPDPNQTEQTGFYYFIAKYEISNLQWDVVMDAACPDTAAGLTAADPRPKTDISWFEAVTFTMRYTEWLLENAPAALPHFASGRFGYIRLPTEAEWEYAARGGHMVTVQQLNREEFFPLGNRSFTDFAVFTDPMAAKQPERLAWIGSRCANPLGLYDTAGNAAEILLDPFRFSLGFRLHGATGGFIAKGGSYRKRLAEIMPGRREEIPFFLDNGAYRATDLGFRVVLSAIVTARNRFDMLDQEWRAKAPKMGQDEDATPGSALQTAPMANPSSLAEATALATIQSALFTAESMINYTRRRQVMVFELERIQLLARKSLPEPILVSIQSDVDRAAGEVQQVDAAISRFGDLYLDRLSQGLTVPEAQMNAQLLRMEQELSLEEGFNESQRSRLELFMRFKEHLDMMRSDPKKLTRALVLEDIIP
ncbi:MAG: SUMF1/EgtB/PvdO family nonheme iron enzyme [Desulfosarcina sp.]|nr:SUMF1/EgtB/PvdO family nonheme iron enzyme [Desulfosarcina sp.]